MSDSNNKSLDVLGIKPVGDAVATVTKATVDGAAAFLSRICLPAAEEFGLLLQDKVRAWRSKNALKIIDVAQQRLAGAPPDLHAHPRLVAAVLEHGTWSEEKTLQEFWGGLLASSCSANGSDDGNIVFTNLLSQLTSLQALVLEYACERCVKQIGANDLIVPAANLTIDLEALKKVARTGDVHRLDYELDNLRRLGLIILGFDPDNEEIDITPSGLALNLYVRCQGFRGPAIDFFGLTQSQPVA